MELLRVGTRLHVFYIFCIISITGLCIISLVYIYLLWYACVAKYSVMCGYSDKGGGGGGGGGEGGRVVILILYAYC